MKTLYLFSSGLRALPDSVGKLTNLENLSISFPINELPESISNLKKIKELTLYIGTKKTDSLVEWIKFLLTQGCQISTQGNALRIKDDWINRLKI